MTEITSETIPPNGFPPLTINYNSGGSSGGSGTTENHDLTNTLWLVNTAGTGYAVSDILARNVVLDTTTTPPTVESASWVNITQGTMISAPNSAHLALFNPSATILATLSGQMGTLITAVTTLQTYNDGLEGYVDGMETLQTATNAALATISTTLSNVANYTDGLEGLLTTLSGYTDTLESLTTTVGTKLQTLIDDTTDASVTIKQGGSAVSDTNGLSTTPTGVTPVFTPAMGNTKYLIGAAGARKVSAIVAHNPHATELDYLQIFDAAAIADVNLASTVPKFVLPLDGKEKAVLTGLHMNFALGIVAAVTSALSATTAPTTGWNVTITYR